MIISPAYARAHRDRGGMQGPSSRTIPWLRQALRPSLLSHRFANIKAACFYVGVT